jgi:hypothetical protein
MNLEIVYSIAMNMKMMKSVWVIGIGIGVGIGGLLVQDAVGIEFPLWKKRAYVPVSSCDLILQNFNERPPLSVFVEVSAALRASPATGEMQIYLIGESIPLEKHLKSLVFKADGTYPQVTGIAPAGGRVDPVRLYFTLWKQGILFAVTSMLPKGGILADFYARMDQPERPVYGFPRLYLDDDLPFSWKKAAENFFILKARKRRNEAIGAMLKQIYRLYFYMDAD